MYGLTIQIESQNLVSFMPVDVTNEDSVNTVLSHIDNMMQYGEDEEPKVRAFSRLRCPAVVPDFVCSERPGLGFPWTPCPYGVLLDSWRPASSVLERDSKA